MRNCWHLDVNWKWSFYEEAIALHFLCSTAAIWFACMPEVSPYPVPPQIVLDLVDRIVQKGKIEESASLVKAYLWRGRNICEIVDPRA